MVREGINLGNHEMGQLLPIQQQEKQQLMEVNWTIVSEGINLGNHEMGQLLPIQLQQQEKQQLKEVKKGIQYVL
jgi:hypothetical protein